MQAIQIWGRRSGEMLLALGLSVMVLMVFGNVVLRYAFDSSITISEEVSRFIFVWLTFGGAVLVFAEGGHVAMNTLTARLPEVWRKACSLLSSALIVLCCGFMLKGGWTQTLINIANVAPVSGIPKGALYVSAVVTAVAIGLMALRNIWRLLNGASAAEVSQQAEIE
jgi:TRAP-type C4-dicarboxylate transport system permease small subunit